MNNLLAALYGLVFGVANIIPGVSGGTMLVVFGCYDKVCGALSLNFKEIKKNIIFLIFFGIGAVLGIIGFSFVISALFADFPIQTYMFFMGLIVGSVPLIIRNATIKEKFRPYCIAPFLAAIVLVVGLSMLEKGGASEPYSLSCTQETGIITIVVENNSDKTVKDWSVGIEEGGFDPKYTVSGAKLIQKHSLSEQIKGLFTDVPDPFNTFVPLEDTAEIPPHGKLQITVDTGGEINGITADSFKLSLSYAMDVPFFLTLLFASLIAAVAMIIPGVSGSFIMVLLGTYSTVIGAIKNLDIAVLIPVAVGVIIGIVFGARLISFLLKKYRLTVFSAILGLVVGSIYAIFPEGFGLNTATLVGAVTFLAGGALSYLVGKRTKVE